MSMFLTGDEIIDLTGKKRRSAQMKELNSLGITHKVRGDGSLVVLRSHIENELDGKSRVSLESVKDTQPNWEGMYNA